MGIKVILYGIVYSIPYNVAIAAYKSIKVITYGA